MMLRILLSLALTLLHAAPSHAQTLRVLSAGAFNQVVMSLVPGFEARTGVKFGMLSDTAGGLTRRIEGGEPFDLVFVTPAALASLSKQGKFDADGLFQRLGIADAMRAKAILVPVGYAAERVANGEAGMEPAL